MDYISSFSVRLDLPYSFLLLHVSCQLTASKGARDANASFTSLTVQNCNLRDHKVREHRR